MSILLRGFIGGAENNGGLNAPAGGREETKGQKTDRRNMYKNCDKKQFIIFAVFIIINSVSNNKQRNKYELVFVFVFVFLLLCCVPELGQQQQQYN